MPVPADALDQPAQVMAYLAARGRLARPQQYRHWAGGHRVIDMDRQKAAFAVMGVEQGQLLMAVHDIDGVVDVQCHGMGWVGVAGAVDVHHRIAQADHLTQARRVLPARHGRL